MITKEQNERLTQTGPDTPGGKMLRMYWHAIGTLQDLEADPVRPVRVLGEDLVVAPANIGPRSTPDYEANLGSQPADSFLRNLHPDLKADYILANPTQWEIDRENPSALKPEPADAWHH